MEHANVLAWSYYFSVLCTLKPLLILQEDCFVAVQKAKKVGLKNYKVTNCSKDDTTTILIIVKMYKW